MFHFFLYDIRSHDNVVHINLNKPRSENSWLASCWNNAGTFIRPEGIMLSSNDPYLHRNEEYSLTASASWICQYPADMSSLLNTFNPFKLSSTSSILRIWYLFAFSRLFHAQWPTHSLGYLSFPSYRSRRSPMQIGSLESPRLKHHFNLLLDC